MVGSKCHALLTIIFIYTLLDNCHSEWNFQHNCDVLDIPESADDPRLLAPWVASIFKKNEGGIWKYHCGATLTASHVVITAASCVSSRERGKWNLKGKYRLHTKYSDLKIVVGLLSSDYYAKRDEYTQEAGVVQIREHRHQQSSSSSDYYPTRNSPTNLAGILLDKEFEFTEYVRPVCLVEEPHSIGEALLLHGGEQALVAGFNVNPYQDDQHKLQNFQFTVQPTHFCLNAYGPHTYYFNVACAQLSGEPRKSEPLPCFMEGAGLIMRPSQPELWDKRYLFLMGVYTANTATILKKYRYDPYQYPSHVLKANTKCTEKDTAFFTKHAEYFGWAISHSFCGPERLRCQDGGCFKHNELCDGIAQCSDRTDESPEVCQNQKNCDPQTQFRCAYGACIDEFEKKVCNGQMDCADNSDESDDKLCELADTRSTATCPPIPKRIGVVTKCSLPGHMQVPSDLTGFLFSATWQCDVNSSPVGTLARQTCARYYKGKELESFKCLRNGTWSSTEFLHCVPDCGISEPPKIPHVAGGENAKARGEWPWHATIYKFVNGYWSIHCGGTLVSTRVILTAAHCVTVQSETTLLNTTDLRLVLGKLRSPYNEHESKFSQEISIENILLGENYNPNTYEADIALIILKYPVQISSSVRPVCFSGGEHIYEAQVKSSEAEFGTVVGFGMDEYKAYSMDLKVIKMPFVPDNICADTFHKSKKEIRYTWFCGGYTNGSGVCHGDSGGGFVFPIVDLEGNRRYYVQGIVSHTPIPKTKPKETEASQSCTNSYEVFTKVKPFVTWIQTAIDETEISMVYEDGMTLDTFLMILGPLGIFGIASLYEKFKVMLANGNTNEIVQAENIAGTLIQQNANTNSNTSNQQTEEESENEVSVPLITPVGVYDF